MRINKLTLLTSLKISLVFLIFIIFLFAFSLFTNVETQEKEYFSPQNKAFVYTILSVLVLISATLLIFTLRIRSKIKVISIKGEKKDLSVLKYDTKIQQSIEEMKKLLKEL